VVAVLPFVGGLFGVVPVSAGLVVLCLFLGADISSVGVGGGSILSRWGFRINVAVASGGAPFDWGIGEWNPGRERTGKASDRVGITERETPGGACDRVLMEVFVL
jgi:hypothetical protein